MAIHEYIARWSKTLNKFGFAPKRSTGAKRRDNHLRRLRIESLESRQMLAVIHVTELTDENDHNIVDGDVSLRDAIEQSTANDTIDFNPTIPNPNLNGGTITLTLGEIAFAKSLTIDASMLSNGIMIDASGNDNDANVDDGGGTRIFSIIDNSTNGSGQAIVWEK